MQARQSLSKICRKFDIVVLSHEYYDHCDLDTLRGLSAARAAASVEEDVFKVLAHGASVTV